MGESTGVLDVRGASERGKGAGSIRGRGARIGATRGVRFGRVDAVTLREREFSGIERVRARAHGAVSRDAPSGRVVETFLSPRIWARFSKSNGINVRLPRTTPSG